MPMFKDHKVSANDLLEVIPDALLSHLSQHTKVDHYAKVLHGKKMFYLLLYGLLENERLSQRTLEETFNDPVFKLLFDLDKKETVRRSSISERLSKIDPAYFQQIYQNIYEQFSSIYSVTQGQKHNIIRVDSSMVSETVGKLMEGLDNKSGKKAVKYTMAFDGVLPSDSEVFTSKSYSSEDIALPELVMSHVKKQSHHQNIYVLDRGLQSTRTIKDFSAQDVRFVCRAKENRKYVELASLMQENQNLDLGESILIKDSIVQLYTGISKEGKTGKRYYKHELVETKFRLVIVQSKQEKGKEY